MSLQHGPSIARSAVLSIDVDDILIANLDLANEPRPQRYASQVTRQLEATLALLAECDSRATFFVNAQYVDELGTLLGEMASGGHEIASHGFHHRDVRGLSIDEFRDDLRRSLEALAAHQDPIRGYRAPAFTMPYDVAHLDVLREEGIRYVSNGVGLPRTNAPRDSEPVALDGGIVHVPISTAVYAGFLRHPVGYGVAARLLPERVAMAAIRRSLRRAPFFHFYCHPFEIAGTEGSVARQLSSRSRRWQVRIYAVRCRSRQTLFRRIFTAARFESIASVVPSAC